MVKRILPFLLVVACQPEPLDEVGAQCSVMRPCSETLFCVAGRCALLPGVDAGRDAGLDAGRDAGVDAGSDAGLDAGADDAGQDGGDDSGVPLNQNLLRNPGFESSLSDGGVPFWNPVVGGVVVASRSARTGNHAALVRRGTLNNPGIQSSGAQGLTSFGMLFCARAWVRLEEEPFSVTIAIRERFPDGGTNASNGGGGQITTRAWTQINESLVTFGTGSSMDVRITTSNFPPDGSLFVDDVQLLRVLGTTCP